MIAYLESTMASFAEKVRPRTYYAFVHSIFIVTANNSQVAISRVKSDAVYC
jgi:hypothetical protein